MILFICNIHNPFPKRQIFEASKLRGFADDNFKFDENDRKFYRWLENTVGKGEIAHYKRLLLQTRKNQGLFGKGLKHKWMNCGHFCKILRCFTLHSDSPSMTSDMF